MRTCRHSLVVAVALVALLHAPAVRAADTSMSQTEVRWDLSDYEMDAVRGGQGHLAYEVTCIIGGGVAGGVAWTMGYELGSLLTGALSVLSLGCGVMAGVDLIEQYFYTPLYNDVFNVLSTFPGFQEYRRVHTVWTSQTCSQVAGQTEAQCVNNFRFQSEVEGVREEWYCHTDTCMCDSNDDCDTMYACMDEYSASGPPGYCRPYFCDTTPC